MLKKVDKNLSRKNRHLKIRKVVIGTPEKPRLSIFRSLKNIYAQIIDDENGKTLVAANNIIKELRGRYGGNIEIAKAIGSMIGKRALEKGIKKVVFDRNGYLYHGRVEAVAVGAREAGLEF